MKRRTPEQRLKEAGLKATRPRLALLESLMSTHGPYTLEEMHKKLRKLPCDFATVYRCLQNFEEKDLVRRCDFGDGKTRYEYQEETGHHHHHIICRKCHTVKTIEDCLVQPIENNIRRQGYLEISHSLEFFGVCQKCAS